MSGRGTKTSGARGIIFEYRAKGASLKGDTQTQTGSNAKPPFQSYTINPYFLVPKVREKGEITISAFLWNCAACSVTWVYQARMGTVRGNLLEPVSDVS